MQASLSLQLLILLVVANGTLSSPRSSLELSGVRRERHAYIIRKTLLDPDYAVSERRI